MMLSSVGRFVLVFIFMNNEHCTWLCTDIYYCTGTVQFRLSEEEVFSVEELLGMIFSHGKKQAEDFTDQKIKVVFFPSRNC